MSDLPKAYLRIDPNIDQVRPDLGAFVKLLCAANRQPRRGRFRSRDIAEHVLGRVAVRRHIAAGDLHELDGWLYVDGWDEWQEGDVTVGERMRRLRAKRHRVTPDDTPPSSHDRIAPSEALGEGVGDRRNGSTEAVPQLRALPAAVQHPSEKAG